jgi:hypothetical protein
MRRKVVLLAALMSAITAVLVSGAGSAGAYGGAGHMGVYQLGVSFNCTNRTLCGSDLGGFWGWIEFDNVAADGQSGTGGDGEFAGCGHGSGFNGAGHTSYDIDTWWIAPDPENGGLPTFYATGIETDSFRGQTQSYGFSGSTGIPAFTVHRPILEFFGVPTPPGMSINVQVAYKPAH